MLTKLTIRNFKCFKDVTIALGDPVVFIGPNNSGKTTALQALALWDIGLKRWNEKRSGKAAPKKRPGVTINRRDLVSVPFPAANLLWHDLHVRDVRRTDGKQQTQNVRIDIVVEGVTRGDPWTCGLEFDYANEESFYCRPLQVTKGKQPERMPIPEAAQDVHLAFLPPMSGLAANETRLDPGAINVRLGEGRTAEILRNLCYQILTADDGPARWKELCAAIRELFGVGLDEPTYVAERGEIVMSYRERSGPRLDLSSAGRGLHQTMLLLTHLAVNPGAVLLLDEPDAHLEILRQRQIYQILSDTAREHGSQVIIASHSEVVLQEAGDRDMVVAFVGKPHRIDDRGSQLAKSLKEIGFDQYYQAEQQGWALYVEGTSDLSILRAFAEALDHPAREYLQRPFVDYIENQPQKARKHFQGLREAKPDLVGYVLCDRLRRPMEPSEPLDEYMWQRREIENYLCQPDTLLAYATSSARGLVAGELFAPPEVERRRAAMQTSVEEFVPRAALRDASDSWWLNTKASDDFLDRLFPDFFARLGLPNAVPKAHYHHLVRYVPPQHIDPEVRTVLDGILSVARRAKPAT